MHKNVFYAVMSTLVLLSAGCATADLESSDPTKAVITIKDKPNAWNNPYRYVVWNNEDYGPDAFVIIARDKGIKKILLVAGDTIQIDCARALGKKMEIPVESGPEVAGGARTLVPDNSTSMSACKIVENIPHPVLSTGEFYVVVSNHKIALEGEQSMEFSAFPQHLTEIHAKAIVMRQPTIADLLCIGAIAAQAGVELKEVQLDGSVTGSKVAAQDQSIDSACKQEQFD